MVFTRLLNVLHKNTRVLAYRTESPDRTSNGKLSVALLRLGRTCENKLQRLKGHWFPTSAATHQRNDHSARGSQPQGPQELATKVSNRNALILENERRARLPLASTLARRFPRGSHQLVQQCLFGLPMANKFHHFVAAFVSSFIQTHVVTRMVV